MSDARQLPLVYTSSDYVSVSWVMRALNCNKDTVYNLLETGVLRGHQLRDRGWWKIRKDSVVSYMEKICEMERA